MAIGDCLAQSLQSFIALGFVLLISHLDNEIVLHLGLLLNSPSVFHPAARVTFSNPSSNKSHFIYTQHGLLMAIRLKSKFLDKVFNVQ